MSAHTSTMPAPNPGVSPPGLELVVREGPSTESRRFDDLAAAVAAWAASGAATGYLAEAGERTEAWPEGLRGLLVTASAARSKGASPASVSLITALEGIRGKVGTKAHAVLAARLVSDDDAEAVRAVQRRLGIGEQRAAQLEAEALDALDAETGCIAAVRQSIADMRDRLPRPLQSLRDEPWAAGVGDAALRRLALAQGGLHVIEIPGEGGYLVPFGPEHWSEALAGLDRLSRDGAARTEAEVAEQAAEALDLPLEARAACARALRILLGRDSPLPLLAASGHWDLVVDAVLPPGGEALDMAGIRAEMDALAPALLDGDALRRVLDRHAIALPGDRYASARDGTDPTAARAVAHRCATLAANAKDGKPVGTDWLLARLDDGRHELPPGLDATGLTRILARSTLMTRVGTEGWTVRPGGRFDPPRRQAEAVLIRHGGPMRAKLVSSQVANLPSRPTVPPAWVGQEVTLLARGMAGLVDRDLPVSGDECRDIANIAQDMVAAGRGATLDELMRDLAAKPYGDRLPEKADVAGVILSLGGVTVGDKTGIMRDSFSPRGPQAAVADRIVLGLLRGNPEGIRAAAAMDAMREAPGGEYGAGAVAKALGRYAVRDGDDPDLWLPWDAGMAEPRPAARIPVTTTPVERRHAYPPLRKPAEKVDEYDWTPERTEILLRLAGMRAGSRRIIAALGGGVTKNAVVSKAYRLGVTVA